MSLFKNFNFNKLKEGLSKTREKIFNSITETVTGKAVIDEITLDRIEEILLGSDIGFDTTEKIIESVKKNLKSEKDRSGENIIEIVKQELTEVLSIENFNGKDLSANKPHIILIVGVNGVGKTTTIGKLANNYKKIGKKVIVGAADTFRAAANEQLEIWAKRADVDIIQSIKGTDPSSVVFETVKKSIDDNYDIVLIDTAGRLHNKTNLMNELDKIRRVIKKLLPDAPHETLLVLDATTGQNAIKQAQEFGKIVPITGLILAKLDGTARGGVVLAIRDQLKIPVKFVGLGETPSDIETFNPERFVTALFERGV